MEWYIRCIIESRSPFLEHHHHYHQPLSISHVLQTQIELLKRSRPIGKLKCCELIYCGLDCRLCKRFQQPRKVHCQTIGDAPLRYGHSSVMMETSHASFLPSLAACVGTYFLFTRFIATTQDPREPPLNSGTIPYVGHVNGLMRSKSDYYIQLRYLRLPLLQHQAMEIVTKSSRSHKSPQPIFTMTMTMPGQKVYVVTTPELFQAIQKQPKAFAFPPIAAKSSSKICGTSLEAHGILMKNATGDDGDWGLSTESYAAMRAALPSGAGFGDMNRMMIRDLCVQG